MTGWEYRHPDLIVTRPAERVDPVEAALVARLAAAGWTVVDKRAGDDVAVTVEWRGRSLLVLRRRVYRGPTTVAALTVACEAVGA